MENLKENWLVLSKMTWGIWQIFTTALGSLKIRTLIGFFCPKLKMHELKIYRGVMCHDNEEWCKIWRGIDLSVQNWHEEFDKFWPEHSKISKICALMGFFWTTYKLFDLKKYRGVMFGSTEYWCNNWRKTDLYFQKWYEEFSKLSPEYIWKSKNWKFDGILLSKVEMCELKIYKGVLCHDNEEWYLIWTGIDMSVQNWQDEYFDTSTRKSQKFGLEQVAFDQSI